MTNRIFVYIAFAFMAILALAGPVQHASADRVGQWAEGNRPNPTSPGNPPFTSIPSLVLPAEPNVDITFNAGFHIGPPTTCGGRGVVRGAQMAASGGLDFGVANGRVASMGPGEVSFVGWLDGGWGWTVVIDLVDPSGTRTGWSIQYSHLQEPGKNGAPNVTLNQRVNRSEYFANQGSSGSDNSHLHVHFLAQGGGVLAEGIEIEGWQFWPAYELNGDQEPTGIYPYEGTAIQGTATDYRRGVSCPNAAGAYYKFGSGETIVAEGQLHRGVGGGGGGSSSATALLEDFAGSSGRLQIQLGQELADLGFINDRVSVVTVPSGQGVGELVCYTETGFVGTPYRYGPGRTYTLTGFQDNVLSSCRFERAGTPTPPAETTITSGPGACVGPSPVTFVLSATNGSEWAWQINDGAYSAFSSNSVVTVSGLGTGDYVLRAKARGQGGEDPTPASWSFSVDATPPTVTTAQTGVTIRPPWFKSDVTTSGSATDVGCSAAGLRFEISRDGGAYSPYAGPILINAEGKWELAFRATDGVGNVTTKFVPVWIDKTSPLPGIKITYTKVTSDSGTVISVFQEITCDDTKRSAPQTPTSGCYQWWWGTSKTNLKLYTGPILLEQKSLPKCSAWSKNYSAAPWMKAEDVAGNVSSVMTASVSVTVSHNDQLNCNATPTPSPAPPGCSISVNMTSVSLGGNASIVVQARIRSVSGFASPVSVSFAGPPIGVTGSLNPAIVTPTVTGATSNLTLTASQPPRGQVATATISGTSGSVSCSPATIRITT